MSKAAVATHLTTSSFAKGCQLCPGEKHPLYHCPKFKTMSLEERRSSLSTSNACFNCLKAGHKASQCQSSHRCKICQKQHHTLLLKDSETTTNGPVTSPTNPQPGSIRSVASHTGLVLPMEPIVSHASIPKRNALLMTCKMMVSSTNGSSVEARAILDPGSTTSFITERLANTLRL